MEKTQNLFFKEKKKSPKFKYIHWMDLVKKKTNKFVNKKKKKVTTNSSIAGYIDQSINIDIY